MENIDLTRPHLTVAQAVAKSGFTRSYVAYLMRKHQLEGFRLGHEWFLYADSFDTFLASDRKPGPKGARKSKE
jgi:hypothetical protein